MQLKFLLFIPYMLDSICNIISVKKDSKLGKHLTKPLLMPLLLLFYLFNTSSPNLFIILALLFGFLGDIFLMGKGSFFITGLICFLVGHVFYIAAMMVPLSVFQIPFSFYVLALPYIFYGTFIYKTLLPYLRSMKIPALIYLSVILLMSFSTLMRIWLFNDFRFWLPFLGSILFICSDTILSFNEFKGKILNRDLYIMATYIAAQALIILGFLHI